MKKTFLLLVMLGFLTVGISQPLLNMTNMPVTVDVYDKYEVTFTMGTYSNPYDPEVIDVYAFFTAPDGRTFRVNGFYFEGYGFKEENDVEVALRQRDNDSWKIRFTPDTPGRWTYVIHAVDKDGETQSKTLAFDCQLKTNAEGFIRTANNQYLKREVLVNGRRGYHSFFPVGPNVAWYSTADYNKFTKPYGIYNYKYYIEALSGNANYMRVWTSRYQYLSLYGPEHAIRENGRPKMYFDSSLNQKDAAELDYIVSYAVKNNINLMLCLFTYGDFRDDSEALEKSEKNGSMPSGWRYNPYHTLLGLEQPVEFFTDPEALRVTRNLVRYYVARWGYATNIVCWELFNEAANIFKNTTLKGGELEAVIRWHNDMAETIRSVDPHQHLVSTSVGSAPEMAELKYHLFDHLDIVQDHNYQNLQKAKSKEQMQRVIFNKVSEMQERYPNKPRFMGEYGLMNNDSNISNATKDPKGIDLHNSLWSSLFSGSMGSASFWFWKELKESNTFDRFKPVMVFSNNLPVLSGTFTAATTGEVKGSKVIFPNHIATYYMVNAAEDTLIGWCQDTAFCYQSLRRLTDQVGSNGHFVNDGVFDPQGYVYTLNSAKRPAPSYISNRIVLPIDNQPRGTKYEVRWFDSETGLELKSETTEAVVRHPWFSSKRIVIEFPSSIRDILGVRINNTFGDAVFMITKKQE